MAMDGGAVAITMNADGTPAYAGSGLALALGTARVTQQLAALAAQIGYSLPPLPTVGSTSTPFSNMAPASATVIDQLRQTLQAVYAQCQASANADGPAIVAYLQGNAAAHVTSEHLGRVPSGGAGTPIDAPSAPVDIPIT